MDVEALLYAFNPLGWVQFSLKFNITLSLTDSGLVFGEQVIRETILLFLSDRLLPNLKFLGTIHHGQDLVHPLLT